MKKVKKYLWAVIFAYVFVLAVNIVGNWGYYAAGNDWKSSVFFSLGVTTFAMVFFGVLSFLVYSRINWIDRPLFKVIMMSVVYALSGVLFIVIMMKGLVWFFGAREQSVYEYINNCVYGALISMVIGFVITTKFSLTSLKKTVEDNE